MRAKDICHTLGTGTTAKDTENLRAKLKRLVARQILTEPGPEAGLFALASPSPSAQHHEKDLYPTAKPTTDMPFRTALSVNRQHAKIRAQGERAVATLKTWKLLAKLHCSPHTGRSPIHRSLSISLTSAIGEPR